MENYLHFFSLVEFVQIQTKILYSQISFIKRNRKNIKFRSNAKKIVPYESFVSGSLMEMCWLMIFDNDKCTVAICQGNGPVEKYKMAAGKKIKTFPCNITYEN